MNSKNCDNYEENSINKLNFDRNSTFLDSHFWPVNSKLKPMEHEHVKMARG